MPMAGTIDTLAAVQDLEKAGIKPEHAQAIIRTVSRADAHLATKADLKAGLATLRSELEQQLIGYLVAAVVIILAAIKYL